VAESDDGKKQTHVLAAFDAGIEEQRRDGVYSHELGRKVPWAEATELNKVGAIVWTALSVSLNGPAVPGDYTLAAIGRNVDYDRLPPLQREMLRDVRARVDAGQLHGQPAAQGMDRTWKALNWITNIDKFDRGLERYKVDGLYDHPKDTPWAEVPEAKKMRAIIRLARYEGAPGEHALAAIEREVDYEKLPPWRREVLKGLRSRLDSSELVGDQANDCEDRANYALRLAEFEAQVEDYKQFGGQDDWGVHHRWADFSEEQKLDKIVREAIDLHLYFEPKEYEIIDREVTLARVPEGRRRGIENNRERLRIGEEEYERRKEAPYVPPDEASAAFKERIENGLWTTCFTDGESVFADWWDLTPESKLFHLARVMDWERVPESYFRTMVERELKVAELPAETRAALENPKDNRLVFSEGFEDQIDGSAPERDANQVRQPEMSDSLPWNRAQREVKVRELFDTANRVQFAELIQERSVDPDIALRPANRVREVYFQQAEMTWDSFQEETEFRSHAEIKEALDLFKAKEAQLGDQPPKTLMDRLQAGGLFLNAGAAGSSPDNDVAPVRDTTRNLVESLMLDVWPRNGAIVDFGLKSQEHYEALYYPLREGEITPEQLDAAMGKGEQLTALAREARSNPHKQIKFRTDWDDLLPEPKDNAGGQTDPLPSPGEILRGRGFSQGERR
jgi:hypothetical protein